ncbi:Immunogenic protein MPT70 precursor [Tautonia plasticadhaerens]|uniref:Immunogenic protein MPT70 n=2 Tax=Tautonia plasticadhaerens TaxID=2527974 RepID=A0A518HDG7_9BACT|nr:fasciclin domain-containing protein [Tautonia plasticadhaerens]QDV38892.1 Immunogenic protein MPT70 precursor [Tautonia plasticadhaerens]
MLTWKLATRLAPLALSAALIGCGGGDEVAPEGTDLGAAPAGDMPSPDPMERLGMDTEGEMAPAGEAAVEPAEPAPAEEAQDIVDIAASNPDFETLVAAVQAADLVETLKGEGPFTVFAPTDDAFEALPEGTLDDLLLPENKEKLASILTYHVVPGKVMAADVLGMGGQSATSVEGSDIPIEVDGETVTVAGATVTATDIEASNGVIHVIDAVIMPPAE